MVIVETTMFTKQVQKLLSNEEYRKLQALLIVRPESGSIIPGGGGLRKIRWGLRGQGKRGGARVIYYWANQREQLLMLFIYPKNVQDNLSAVQLKMLRQIIEEDYP